MVKLKIIFSLVIILIVATVPAAATIFDNSGGGTWRQYMCFPITSPTTTYAQYKIVISGNTWYLYNATGTLKVTGTNPYFWNLVQSNGADIRVFNNSGAQMYFWIETFNPTSKYAVIWVNLTPGSTELNVAYGNPNATTSLYDNGTKTFLFFDDFSGTLAKWTQNLGTWTITNGKLTVETDHGAPGNVITAWSVTQPFVAYVDVTLGSEGGAFGLYNAGAIVFAGIDHLTELYIITYNGVWGSPLANVTHTYTQGEDVKLSIIYNGNALILRDLTNNLEVKASMTLSSSYKVGCFADAGETVFPLFDNFIIASLNDPATFSTPYVVEFGWMLKNGLMTKVTYLSAKLPQGVLMVNVTNFYTKTVTTYTPIMTYIPYNGTFNASASVAVTGINATYGANITILLDANRTLSKVIYNNTDVTANLTAVGTQTINGITYNVWNLTVYENGTLVVYAITPPVTKEIEGIWLYPTYNVKDIPLRYATYISGVNATYGANLTIYLNANLTLDKLIYNNTDYTTNLTYIGSEIINNNTYKMYNLTVYENGTLNVSAHIYNIGLNTTYILDGETVNITNVTAVLGEVLNISLPWTGNISIGTNTIYNTKQYVVNTKDLGTGSHEIRIVIEDPTHWKFGYIDKFLRVVYGSLNITVKGTNTVLTPQFAIYNARYGFTTGDTHRLWAGLQKINIYYHGLLIKQIQFYLNHSTNGANITVNVNATAIRDYRGLNRTIVSAYAFNVTGLRGYATMTITHNGTVIVDYGRCYPAEVKVVGSPYKYEPPYLYIYGSGTAKVIDLYRLRVKIKDKLGNPLNFYIIVNNTRIYAKHGIVTNLTSPEYLIVRVPDKINGFVVYSAYPDNGNGGSWSEEVVLKLNRTSPVPAVYLLQINGSNWSVVNYKGSVKINFTVPGFWNMTKSDGSDIRVLDQTGTELHFYIAKWNYTAKYAEIYFELRAGSSEVRIIYGNKLARPSVYQKTLSFNNSDPVNFTNATVIPFKPIIYMSSNAELPVISYKVPTHISTREVRLTSFTSWIASLFGYKPKQVPLVRLEGHLSDYYGDPISGATVTITIKSPHFTRVYNVTTDSSGNFYLDVDLARGIQYTITYSFAGNDVYVGSTLKKSIKVEQLPTAPGVAPSKIPLILIVVLSCIACIVVAVIILKRRAEVARVRIERSFRFYRRRR